MDYTFSVKRSRGSVTQGEATVYLNGVALVTFGDKIELIKEGQEYHGEMIGGWASTTSDGAFVHGVLFHPYEDYYHYSDKVRNFLKSGKKTAPTKEAAGLHV